MSSSCPKCDFDWSGLQDEAACPKCGTLRPKIGEATDAATDQATIARPMTLDEPFAAEPVAHTRQFGDYEILHEIARGGMGVVYKARQISLDRIVALKMILHGSFAAESDVERFAVEAQAAARLDHPGIVPIYDFGEVDGKHFFSMALVEGSSLEQRIAQADMAEIQVAQLASQIAEAVAYAHQNGVIHRDLKPANILVDPRGMPRVTDFGLAKQLGSESQLTVTGQTLGTPSYMPPEQAGKTGVEIGPAADIYALGAILYALITGKPPFVGDSLLEILTQVMQQEPIPPRQLNRDLHQDLETICLKCLEKEPDQRYASANDLVDDLKRFINGEPISARPQTMFGTIKRWRQICARSKDVRIKSNTRLMGLPLVAISLGRDTRNGETKGHAKGIIAYGDRATGLIAFGGLAMGVFAFGQYALGLVSFGMLSAGVFSAGLISGGGLVCGGVAIGYAAFGAVAIGRFAVGMVAIGLSVSGAWFVQIGR